MEKWYFLERIWIAVINSCIDDDGKDETKGSNFEINYRRLSTRINYIIISDL